MFKILVLMCMLCVLSACQGGGDTLITLEAESIGYAAEATALRETALFEQSEVNATAQAASTEIAALNGINQQLVATVSRQVTPTPVIEGIGVPLNTSPLTNPIAVAPAEGDTSLRIVSTGTSTSVNDADGCVLNASISFSPDASRIYATAQTFNLTTGTRLRADWSYQGTLRYDYAWTVEQDYETLCIWFYIDPSITEFTPGSWSVQLYRDDTPAGSPMTFIIEDMMNDG